MGVDLAAGNPELDVPLRTALHHCQRHRLRPRLVQVFRRTQEYDSTVHDQPGSDDEGVAVRFGRHSRLPQQVPPRKQTTLRNTQPHFPRVQTQLHRKLRKNIRNLQSQVQYLFNSRSIPFDTNEPQIALHNLYDDAKQELNKL
jgi:hypothetical protein